MTGKDRGKIGRIHATSLAPAMGAASTAPHAGIAHAMSACLGAGF
jgi:hypothetical protein